VTTTASSPRVLAPADANEVAATLRACANDGAAIVAQGGGTLQSIGNAPTRCDVMLSLERVRGFAEYDPRDLTAGIFAGTPLAEVARTLREFGQQLPFDAPLAARATIGGTIAAGWAGPRRGRYGRPRDLLIGTTVALADGTLAHAGGMVVKNVTGYDMSKAYAGSLGTLAIIVRANVKAVPRPAALRLAVAPIPPDVSDRAIAAIGTLAIEPSAALAIDGFTQAAPLAHATRRLVVFFEGSEALVERATRELRSVLGAAGVAETQLADGDAADRIFAGVIDAYVDANDRSLTYRSTGLPSTAWARAQAATALGAPFGLAGETIADLRTGDVIVRASARRAARFAEVVAGYDATVRRTIERTTVLAGAPALRATIDAWGAVPSTIDAMRRLKAHFDPANVLAPGRYVGGI
jgi:glycolate oxidase FAD binding subunit